VSSAWCCIVIVIVVLGSGLALDDVVPVVTLRWRCCVEIERISRYQHCDGQSRGDGRDGSRGWTSRIFLGRCSLGGSFSPYLMISRQGSCFKCLTGFEPCSVHAECTCTSWYRAWPREMDCRLAGTKCWLRASFRFPTILRIRHCHCHCHRANQSSTYISHNQSSILLVGLDPALCSFSHYHITRTCPLFYAHSYAASKCPTRSTSTSW
jgi:hypothetical protein